MKRRPAWVRAALPLLMAAALAACDAAQEVPPAAAVEGLSTVVVASGDAEAQAWDGVVEAVRQATLTAQTSGRVLQVLHDVNDRVAAGAVLVRLSAMEQQAGLDAARAQLRATEAAAAEAEATYQRYLELSREHYVSKLQLDQVRTQRDSAVAARDAAAAQVAYVGQQSAYTTVRAPYAGVVASRDVEPGESIGTGQSLMTVFAPGALRIEVSIPQSEALKVRANPAASVVFADGRRVEATGVTVFPAADAATHAVKVRVQLPPLDVAPHPGTTASVAFPAVACASLPRVPLSALVRRGEVSAVYVLTAERLSLRQLRLGSRVGEEIDVIAGLAAGEIIAADSVAAAQALAAARGQP